MNNGAPSTLPKTARRRKNAELADPTKTDQLPPHCDRTERATLGAVLLAGENDARRAEVPAMLAKLTESDFYLLAHRDVYIALSAVAAAGRGVDTVMLFQRLKATGKLDHIGGPAAIDELTSAAVSAGAFDDYCAILKDFTARRAAITDATTDAQRMIAAARDLTKPVSKEAGELQPWPSPVDGADLLDALAAEFRRFLFLKQPFADMVLALWALHTYAWELSEFSPIVAITSPTRACGKSRVLDVLEKLVNRPFRTGNMSEAVLFRVLDSRKPCALIDEFDSIPDERREALGNILKHGFHRSGRVHRVEGEGKKDVIEFCAFGPKALACIKLSTLDAATVSRCINIRMQRKSTDQKVERLRKYDATELRSKCLRWANDNRAAIADGTAQMPDTLGDREQDIWEPLFVLASLAGGHWPETTASTALAFAGQSADAQQDASTLVLGWMRTYFDETGNEKVASADLVEWLKARPDAPFSSWNDGKGIRQTELRRHLAGFDIQPDTVRLSPERTAKGYAKSWFNDAFEAYPPENPTENGNTVTKPVNIGRNGDLAPVTDDSCYSGKTAVSPNKDGLCYSVTNSRPENDPLDELTVQGPGSDPAQGALRL